MIGAIADLDADVTSIEAARSHMEVLDDLNSVGFANSVGPGVYDIHSPRVPSTDEMAASLRAALKAVPAERLWVNPDCGLKTRNADEVTASLQNMVAAAQEVRAGASASASSVTPLRFSTEISQCRYAGGSARGGLRRRTPARFGRFRQHLDRHVVGPGLPGHHVGDFDDAALELAGRRVHQPIGLGLLVDRLRVEQHHPHLAGLEVAALLHRGDQLLVVHVAVAEIPPDGGAADAFPVGEDVVVLVLAGHRPVRQREQRPAVSVEGAERISHVHRDLRLLLAVEPLQLGLRACWRSRRCCG